MSKGVRPRPTERIADFLAALSRKPVPAWGVTALLFLLALLSVSHLEMDHRFNIWFGPKDPITRDYRRFQEEFGTDENLIVVYRNPELFSREELELNRRLSQALSEVPHVARVVSLTTLQVPRVGLFGPSVVPLIPEQRGDPEQLEAWVRSKIILRDNLISADGSATGIVLTLDTEDPAARRSVVDSVRAVTLDPVLSSNRYHLVGVVPILTEMHRVSGAEAGRFVAISSGVMFLLLWVYFGSLLAPMAAVAVSLLTILMTLALFAAAGQTVNMVAGVMPLVLLVVSVSVSVHILSRMNVLGSETRDPDTLSRGAILPILRPCFFSSLTTACAFWSFTLSSIPPLRAFGLFCGIGVLLSFLLAFILVPGLVTVWGRRAPEWKGPGRWDAGAALARMVSGILRRRALVWAVSLGILLCSVVGIMRLTFETDQIKYLEASNPVRADNDQALQWFEGAYSLEILLELPDSVQNRPIHYLELFDSLEKAITDLPEVVAVHSAATAVRDFIPEGLLRPVALAVMARAEAAADSVAPGSGVEFRYLGSSGTRARISVRTPKLGQQEIRGLLGRLDETIREPLAEAGVGYSVTGAILMYMSINRHLTRSQVRSIMLSFGCILILLALLFRDPRLALLGMIPNVLPVATTVGVMGLAGVSMDVATVLIAAISLGIAVDDTIHLLWAFREEAGETRDLAGALRRAVGRVGRPLVLTSLLLVAGFLVMTMSSYLPVVYLGIFVSLNVLLAICYDLLLLPTLLPSVVEEDQGPPPIRS